MRDYQVQATHQCKGLSGAGHPPVWGIIRCRPPTNVRDYQVQATHQCEIIMCRTSTSVTVTVAVRGYFCNVTGLSNFTLHDESNQKFSFAWDMYISSNCKVFVPNIIVITKQNCKTNAMTNSTHLEQVGAEQHYHPRWMRGREAQWQTMIIRCSACRMKGAPHLLVLLLAAGWLGQVARAQTCEYSWL